MQQELEKLNACTEEINLLETQLEDANCLFRYVFYCVPFLVHLSSDLEMTMTIDNCVSQDITLRLDTAA